MNIKLIVLLLVVLSSVYRMILNIVQYRSANNPTPANVADVYDAETYKKWKAYSAENCRLSMISTAVSCIVTLCVLASNAYSAFASLFPEGIRWQFFAVVLLETVIDIGVGSIFGYVNTMVVEQKYGFNRSTLKTFVIDQLRSFAIELVLSLALVWILSALHMSMGDWMIVLFAGAVFVISLVISFLYPFISRMGNKFVPLEDGELKDRLMALLTSHGYKVKAIEVMDASRRTTKLNAYFTGFGKMKTIVLYDNLVNAMSTDEICAVFAHELGHGLNKDVLKQQIMNIGNLLLMAVVVWFAVRESSLHTAFGFANVNYGFGFILLSVGLGILQPITGMAMNAYSRFAEYRADRQAVKEGHGAAMITALKKLAKENFAHLSPSRVYVVLEYSHPPLASRIEEVEKAMKARS